MKPVESIPTAELRADLDSTLIDIALCEKAMAIGVTEYGGGRSTHDRLEMNERVRDIIEAELERRGAASVVVLGSRLNTRDERSRMTEREYFNSETETQELACWWDGLTLGHDGQLVEVVFD